MLADDRMGALIADAMSWIHDSEAPPRDQQYQAEPIAYLASVWIAQRTGQGCGTCDAMAHLKLGDGKARKAKWYAKKLLEIVE